MVRADFCQLSALLSAQRAKNRTFSARIASCRPDLISSSKAKYGSAFFSAKVCETSPRLVENGWQGKPHVKSVVFFSDTSFCVRRSNDLPCWRWHMSLKSAWGHVWKRRPKSRANGSISHTAATVGVRTTPMAVSHLKASPGPSMPAQSCCTTICAVDRTMQQQCAFCFSTL